jgi:predicted transcriptional regulator
MTLTLDISPELRDKLAEEAKRLARPLEAVALQAIEESLGGRIPGVHTNREQWQREFEAWVTSHHPISHAVDDSRENIYGDDGR